MRDEPEPLRLLADELLRYVMTNPDAKDTLEGIHRWWLAQPEQWSTADVRTVMDRLVREGSMTASSAAPGLRLFGPSAAFLAKPAAFTRRRRERRS